VCVCVHLLTVHSRVRVTYYIVLVIHELVFVRVACVCTRSRVSRIRASASWSLWFVPLSATNRLEPRRVRGFFPQNHDSALARRPIRFHRSPDYFCRVYQRCTRVGFCGTPLWNKSETNAQNSSAEIQSLRSARIPHVGTLWSSAFA